MGKVIKYQEFEMEIIDHRDVKHIELLRVSDRKVLDLVVKQRIGELPQPPKKVTIKEVTEFEND